MDGRRLGKRPVDLPLRAIRKVGAKLFGTWQPESTKPEVTPGWKARSDRINAAFKRARSDYVIPTLPLTLHYFRPRDEEVYRIASGDIDFVENTANRVNEEHNGWDRYFASVVSFTVPGGHYDLAHGANAKTLAAAFRTVLEASPTS